MSTPVRAVLSDDLAALARLHAQCFPEGWTRDALADLLAGPGVFGLAVGQADGFILARVAFDEAEILTICVSPDLRRGGLGHALVGEAAARASHMGAKRIFLEVAAANEAARSLYEKQGFRPVGNRKGYYGPMGDALILHAPLPLAFRMGNRGETA
jgi:ribosomal-protein-alanine N-acetyltransferase